MFEQKCRCQSQKHKDNVIDYLVFKLKTQFLLFGSALQKCLYKVVVKTKCLKVLQNLTISEFIKAHRLDLDRFMGHVKKNLVHPSSKRRQPPPPSDQTSKRDLTFCHSLIRSYALKDSSTARILYLRVFSNRSLCVSIQPY